jgi:alkylation response protein AidB-like acyl-CoA dehydrogenase
MDFAFTAEQDELRASVQAFIKENLTEELRNELTQPNVSDGHTPRGKAFLKMIHDRNWFAMTWPKEYGGQGRGHFEQYIVEEEFFRAASLRVGDGGSGVPAILASGTEAQKREFVSGSFELNSNFCQGYSEPGCGTDLAGVRCRAALVRDKYIINGQKTFTTNAQSSTHIFLMVRTDPESRRQAGLSVLLVPMSTPGITVRPLWTIQNDPRAPVDATYGEARTNEVFFDNVEVPASCLLGKEGDGWAVTQRGLNLDRVGAWRYLTSVRRDEDIVNYLKTGGELTETLRHDPRVRDKIAELWIEGQVCRLMTLRSVSIEENGGNFTYEGSAEKVWAPEHGVRSTEAISQILGPYAQLMNSSPFAVDDGVFAHSLLGAFQSTVNHGSAQVMRDQIARKGLSMPRTRR